MTDPTLDPIVQRAMVSNDVAYEVLPCDPDIAVMGQVRVVMGGGNRSSKLLLNPDELTKLPNVVVVEGLAKPK